MNTLASHRGIPPSCSLSSLRWQGELESSRPKALCPQGEAVTVSHPSALRKVVSTVVAHVLVSSMRTRTQPFQGPGPGGGGLDPRRPGACQPCCGGGGSPHPKKNAGSRLLETRAFPGPVGNGISPQSDLLRRAAQLVAAAPAICAEQASVGAGPSCPRQPLRTPHPCTALAECGSSLWAAGAVLSRPGTVRTECSEGLRARETRKCVACMFKRDNRLQ